MKKVKGTIKRVSEAQSPEEAVKTPLVAAKRSQRAFLIRAFNEFLSELSSGQPAIRFLERNGIGWETLHRLLDERPEYRENYSRAQRYCVHKYVSEIVPMSDAVIGEEMNVVTATRNAVDARKWLAGKLAPREYGDAPSGVTINNQTNVLVVSEDRLKSLQAIRQKMLGNAPSLPTHDQAQPLT